MCSTRVYKHTERADVVLNESSGIEGVMVTMFFCSFARTLGKGSDESFPADIRILCIPSVNTKSYGERSFSYTVTATLLRVQHSRTHFQKSIYPT